jgi:hypothetical protein
MQRKIYGSRRFHYTKESIFALNDFSLKNLKLHVLEDIYVYNYYCIQTHTW